MGVQIFAALPEFHSVAPTSLLVASCTKRISRRWASTSCARRGRARTKFRRSCAAGLVRKQATPAPIATSFSNVRQQVRGHAVKGLSPSGSLSKHSTPPALGPFELGEGSQLPCYRLLEQRCSWTRSRAAAGERIPSPAGTYITRATRLHGIRSILRTQSKSSAPYAECTECNVHAIL